MLLGMLLGLLLGLLLGMLLGLLGLLLGLLLGMLLGMLLGISRKKSSSAIYKQKRGTDANNPNKARSKNAYGIKSFSGDS
jgi:F0F1-type ATP synthase assembly protein I